MYSDTVMETVRNAVTIAAAPYSFIDTLPCTLLSHKHDNLSLFFLMAFFFVVFLHAPCSYIFGFFLAVSLSAFFSLGRMHMSHGVSSPSSNRPLNYGDFIYRSLPHKSSQVLGK